VRDWEAELAGCEARRGPGIQDGHLLSNPKLERAGLHDGTWEEALAGDGARDLLREQARAVRTLTGPHPPSSRCGSAVK
jgi:hypothetical protein